MAQLTPPSGGEGLGTYRVPVTFEVSARSPHEARALLDDALTGDPNSAAATVQEHARILEDGDVWGVLGWKHELTSTAHAVVLANKQQLLSELGTIEVLRALLDGENSTLSSKRTLTDGELDQIRSALQMADRFIVVDDPNMGAERPLFDGHATEAVGLLPPGIYDGSGLGGQSLILAVGVSRFTPSGYAAATFPASTFDSSVLDRISRTMQHFTRHTTLAGLLAEISDLVCDTGRDAVDPDELHLVAGRPHRAPTVSVGVIVWSEDPEVEPTIMIGPHSVPLVRELATMLHAELADSDAFHGAQQFLNKHTGPEDWRSAEDVDNWLNALSESTPYPRVTLTQQPLSGGVGGHGRFLAQALAARATQLNITPTAGTPSGIRSISRNL